MWEEKGFQEPAQSRNSLLCVTEGESDCDGEGDGRDMGFAQCRVCEERVGLSC